MIRRQFLARLGAALATGGLAAVRFAPSILERSPRYILHPETGVMYERLREGVYQAMTR